MKSHTRKLSIMMSVLLVVAALPLSARAQTQTQDEIQAQIQAELEVFLQSSSEDALRAEVWRRVDASRQSNLDNPPIIMVTFDDTAKDFQPEFALPDETPGQRCVRAYTTACRQGYNADIAGAAAQATTVLAGCLALTTGAGLIACGALALAVQQYLSLQARRRYQACLVIIPEVCDMPSCRVEVVQP